MEKVEAQADLNEDELSAKSVLPLCVRHRSQWDQFVWSECTEQHLSDSIYQWEIDGL